MFDLGLNAEITRHKVKREAHLIDGSNMFCAAHSSTLSLTVSRFCNLFSRAKSAQYIAVAFDDSAHTWRHDLYPAYKSNRQHRVFDSLRVIRHLLKLRGIRIFCSKRYEADDLIASAVSIFDCPVYIHSDDKDFFQLLSSNINIIRQHKRFGLEQLDQKFGLTPATFLDYQTLVGDSVDCIPGVPMWGHKSAQEYLIKYGDLPNIIRHRKELPTKLRNGLVKGRSTLNLTRKLVRLKRNLLDVPADYFEVQEPDVRALTLYASDMELTLPNFL